MCIYIYIYIIHARAVVLMKTSRCAHLEQDGFRYVFVLLYSEHKLKDIHSTRLVVMSWSRIMYVCIYICVCIHIRTHVHACMRACLCVLMPGFRILVCRIPILPSFDHGVTSRNRIHSCACTQSDSRLYRDEQHVVHSTMCLKSDMFRNPKICEQAKLARSSRLGCL
jgi:hypothetical protein